MTQHDCPVCCEELPKCGKNVVTSECGHKFHYSCLFRWNIDNTSCPMCRTDFTELPEPTPQVQPQNSNQIRDMLEPMNNEGLAVHCITCNFPPQTCLGECGQLFCMCYSKPIGFPIGSQIRPRNPLNGEEAELQCCLDCYLNRYETVHYMLDQQMTNSALTNDEIFELDPLYDMWGMYFHNTNTSLEDDIPSFERAEMTNFDEYEDFVDHIRMTYRQHTLDSFNDHFTIDENDEDLENILPINNYENEVDTDVETDIDEPIELVNEEIKNSENRDEGSIVEN